MSISKTMQHRNAHTMAQNHAKTSFTIWVERVLWATWIPLVLFTVFFTSIPDVHNGMHPVRHSTTIVQCH